MVKCSPVHHQPMQAVVIEGEVVVTGPGPMAGAFTPHAAELSAHAILDAAREAREHPVPESPARPDGC